MADLFDAVYANPDDDAPREALAAFLTQQRDPRGAFITQQLKGEKGGALLRAHAKKWLAPVADVLVASTVKWERGFPVAGRLNLAGKWMKSPKTRGTLGGNTAVATLRALKLNSGNTLIDRDVAAKIVMLPALRRLRELEDAPRFALAEMAAATPAFALQRIVCGQEGGDGVDVDGPEKRDWLAVNAALAKGSGLPALTDLRLDWSHGADKPTHYPWVFTSPLQTLRLYAYYLTPLLAWHDALSKAKNVALERIEFCSGAKITLERTAKGWTALRGATGEDKYGGTKREIAEVLGKLREIDVVEVEGYP